LVVSWDELKGLQAAGERPKFPRRFLYRIGYLVKLFRSGRKSRQFINLLIPTIGRFSFYGLGRLLSAKVFENP
jgi:hypothetical protein